MKKKGRIQTRAASHSGLPEARTAIETMGKQVTDAITDVRSKVETVGGELDGVRSSVAELGGRIEAVEDKATRALEHNPGERIKDLVSGEVAERFADIGDRLNRIDAQTQRSATVDKRAAHHSDFVLELVIGAVVQVAVAYELKT